MNTSKKVFILSWPAGVWKTTLWHNIEWSCPSIQKIITTTSRSIRENEVDGKDYHFINRDIFEEKIKKWEFIEYAVVHTNYYGSTFEELDRIIEQGRSPIYIIEPQWMVHLKPILEKEGYTVITIFLLPPSLDELKRRLHNRWTETEEQFQIRLATAMTELEQQDFYDIRLVNNDLKKTKDELIAILHM
jgi:guanylate kinase